VFVLGKGGVGRSTVAAALGVLASERGERALVVEWTLAEAIAPWFGDAPAGTTPREVAPGLSVMNFRLDEVLRQYFVDHLGLGLFYRRVVDGPHVRQLVEAAPGIAELMFVGHLWWLTTLAEAEAGLRFDRVIVDAPATGHGASLFDLPSLLASLGASGLLAVEVERVVTMMADPRRVGALVVTLPEELAADETLELVPQLSHALGRRPLLCVVNRSVGSLIGADARAPWLDAVGARLSPAAREGLEVLHAELCTRARLGAELERTLVDATEHGTLALEEHLAVEGGSSPIEVVRAAAWALREKLEAAP
jgi:anion-transporting  ArsA/GET3 family ATPase